MDRIANVKAQLKLQEWAQRIADCQSSDKTVAAWCEANNINTKTYYYWLRKVRNHTLNQMPAIAENLPAPAEDKPVTFKQLEVTSPIHGKQPAVIVRLANATIEISAGTDQKTVEAVLLALKAVC